MAGQSPPADLALQVQHLLASLPGTLPSLSERSFPSDIAGQVDHTLLAPSATSREIIAATLEAVELGAKTVCAPSGYVRLAHETLAGVPAERQQAGATKARPLPICTVGFPHGNASSYAKAQETKRAVEDGAAEIDMVQNVGLVKEGRWADLWSDIKAVVDAAKGSDRKVALK
ncbi:aldolase [Microstroma glucosiphilum]|uniref:Aldolase n=1 Tax=Pseudomicrostroma glucosiphilum TaxID=1684307 RepID=A0A316U238_9BASI|nr:aldolase [Pseudomicrostroma glucosiphilum]PWN18551.1 aldolase [Pseudomicrostroma glucosiphilum]